MSTPRTVVVAASAALALATVGCGGGGKTASTATARPAAPATAATTAATPPPSGGKVDLPKPYSTVATDVQRRLDALASSGKIPSAKAFGTARFNAAARDLARDVERTAAELEAAQPPVPVTALHRAILGELRAIAADFRTLAQASAANNPAVASRALGRIVASLGRVRSDIRRVVSTVD
jgi:hypothetical protein